MTSEPIGRPSVTPAAGIDVETEELWDRCARPACRRNFQRGTDRGRPREYCSDTCKKNADREYKKAQAAVPHFEKLLTQARADVAAFGRPAEGRPAADPGDDLAAAVGAWRHAGGAVEFAQPGDLRLHEVLRDLVEALDPILNPPS